MTYRKLIKLLCSMEGKKAQVSVGNMREIVRIVAWLTYRNPEVLELLLRLGKKQK